MSYREIINQKIGAVYQAGIATKIMQHMGRIRNSSDLNQARRWVMELLQNAGDVAWPGEPVKVKLELSDKELKFMHTGKPFRIKDILSIVNQVSSKVDDENTVGQFGTGFVTTFQLSEKVNLKGVLKEEREAYKAFDVNIDRRGNTQEEILKSIDCSMNTLRQVDEGEEQQEYCRDKFHTVFTYFLDNERSKSIARIGMDDLRETVFFVLLFSENISSIELQYHTEGTERHICYTKMGNKLLGNGLSCGEFQCLETGRNSEIIRICYLKKGEVTLAANYSEEEGFLPISEKCPRLFVNFPLIGAEGFCFPVVINSKEFEPNEPRSGISLVDNEHSADAKVNKKVMEQAVELYKTFVTAALDLSLKGIGHILQMPVYEDSKEWSKEWVKGHIYKPLYEDIISRAFIETIGGRRAIQKQDMCLVRGDSAKERSAVKELLSCIEGVFYPTDEVDWYYVLGAYEIPEDKVYDLDKLLEQAEDIIRQTGKIKEEAISIVKWCEKLCYTALKREELARRIYAGEIAIFPNQVLESGRVWYLKKIQEIYKDPGIPEILKDVTEVLDKITPRNTLSGMDSCNLRGNLLHRDFVIAELEEVFSYDWGRLGNYIATKSSERFPVMNYNYYASAYKECWQQAWLMMVCCGPDKGMYDLVKQCFSRELPAYEKCDAMLEVNVWSNSYYGLLQYCIREISWYPKVEALPWNKSEKCVDIYAWLNLFYEKWLYYRHGDEDGGAAIYLNQHGEFKNRISIRRDKIASEELKEIAYELKDLSGCCDFYEQLLHNEIVVEGILPTEYVDKDVALEINRVVSMLLAQKNLSEANISHQEACSALLAWIQNHPEAAERYFPSFSSEEEQMKLLTPKAAVRMNQKVRKLEHIMELLSCEDEEQILEMIQDVQKKQAVSAENPTLEGLDGEVILDENVFEALGISMDDEESLGKVCHEIGVAGERYALEQVREYYRKQGMEIVCDNESEIVLRDMADAERTVTILYPDTTSYHQKGWDICIKDSEDRDNCQYLEVKTHTSRSYVRKHVRLSNEQMKKAITERENYHVLVVVYDFCNKMGREIIRYESFLSHIANGELKHMEGGYLFVA